MARYPSPRRVKSTRTYTVDEAARLLGVHKNTVRRWLIQGLAAIDERRPLLIHGPALIAFLGERRAKRKQPCGPGRMYCVRCRAPKRPAGGMADFEAGPGDTGMLTGICPDCEGLIYRRVRRTKLDEVREDLEVTLAKAEPRICDSPDLLVNDAFKP